MMMSFKFVTQPLLAGLYEPEGLYLHIPLAGRFPIIQFWGEHPEFHLHFSYNGAPLKGHIGLDFAAPLGTRVLAVDRGRVIEISYEPKGFGRYLKIEHSWGESFYAHLEEMSVESGQMVTRAEPVALTGDNNGVIPPQLHFGLRIKPFNRFDGWGGFTDPLPFFSAADLLPIHDEPPKTELSFSPTPMAIEATVGRRP
jgi:murein DD-endopeptidase MepM/ murein hydrolase activator NlpD